MSLKIINDLKRHLIRMSLREDKLKLVIILKIHFTIQRNRDKSMALINWYVILKLHKYFNPQIIILLFFFSFIFIMIYHFFFFDNKLHLHLHSVWAIFAEVMVNLNLNIFLLSFQN